MLLYIVLMLEIMFYISFFIFSKDKGNLLLYILTFTIATICLYFLYDYRLLGYLLFILISILGIKYIVRASDGTFDILLMLIAMGIKLILEPICFIFYIFIDNVYLCTIIASEIKILLSVLLESKIHKLYLKLKKDWYDNKFYIRYITSIGLMLYIIATCILLVINLI